MHQRLLYAIQLLILCVLGCCSSCKPTGNTIYYPNGQVRAVDSIDQKGQVCSVTRFRPDGTLKRVVPYRNGLIQGILKRYDRKGKLESTETWVNGHQQGLVTGYYPNGRVWFTKTMRDSLTVDTSHVYYPTGEERQLIVRTAQGRRIDFGAWLPNGLIDTSYTRVIFLSDTDTVRQGQDYAFEVRLGNRRSNHGAVSLRPFPVGLDSTKGTYAATRYIIRHPMLGTHLIRGQIRQEWARKGSDTVWIDYYGIKHTFQVVKNRNLPQSH